MTVNPVGRDRADDGGLWRLSFGPPHESQPTQDFSPSHSKTESLPPTTGGSMHHDLFW